MTKQFFACLILALVWAFPSWSAEVGDIYYHDKTFSNKVDPDKVPIGVVFWVAPDKNFGLIVSIEQLSTPLNSHDAKSYCANFQTLGTKVGDWTLPRIDDLQKLGNSYKNGKLTNNFTTINNVLKKVPLASQLKAANYIAYGVYGYWAHLSNGYVGYAGSTSAQYEVRCITGF